MGCTAVCRCATRNLDRHELGAASAGLTAMGFAAVTDHVYRSGGHALDLLSFWNRSAGSMRPLSCRRLGAGLSGELERRAIQLPGACRSHGRHRRSLERPAAGGAEARLRCGTGRPGRRPRTGPPGWRPGCSCPRMGGWPARQAGAFRRSQGAGVRGSTADSALSSHQRRWRRDRRAARSSPSPSSGADPGAGAGSTARRDGGRPAPPPEPAACIHRWTAGPNRFGKCWIRVIR